MVKNIEFPDIKPAFLIDRDCLSFPAHVDKKCIECLLTLEFLWSHFGLRDRSEQAMNLTYQEHRSEIQNIAKEHIQNGWIDEENRIILTRWFTRLRVTYDERLSLWKQGDELAKGAQHILTKIIGPNVREVDIHWTSDVDSSIYKTRTLTP